MTNNREIPLEYRALIQQAVLNLALTAYNTPDAFELAITNADAINAEYDAWVADQHPPGLPTSPYEVTLPDAVTGSSTTAPNWTHNDVPRPPYPFGDLLGSHDLGVVTDAFTVERSGTSTEFRPDDDDPWFIEMERGVAEGRYVRLPDFTTENGTTFYNCYLDRTPNAERVYTRDAPYVGLSANVDPPIPGSAP